MLFAMTQLNSNVVMYIKSTGKYSRIRPAVTTSLQTPGLLYTRIFQQFQPHSANEPTPNEMPKGNGSKRNEAGWFIPAVHIAKKIKQEVREKIALSKYYIL